MKNVLEKLTDLGHYVADNLQRIEQHDYFDLDNLIDVLSDLDNDISDLKNVVNEALDRAWEIDEAREQADRSEL